MNKNTMFFGLLIAGGLLAYYAWKKQSATTSSTSNSTSTGTFVDDIPVTPNQLGIMPKEVSALDTVKNTVSKIIDPLISTKKQEELSGQGQFLES